MSFEHKLPRHAVAIGLVTLALAGCGRVDPEAEMAAARTALTQHDGKTAVIHLKNVLEKDPKRADARFLLGRALLDGGDAAGALVEFGKAAQAGHPNEALLPWQARAMVQQREYKRAIEQFGSATPKDPNDAVELKLALASAQGALGHRDEAGNLIEQALALNPKSVPARLSKARLLMAERKPEQALEIAETLIKEDAKSAEGWRIKGDVASLRGDNEAMRKAYEAAVEADPRNLPAATSLLAHLMSIKDRDEATKRLAAMRKTFGGVGEVVYFSAALELDKNNLQQAFDHVQQLLKLAPDDPRALFLAAQIEFQRGNFLPAEAHLNKMLARGVDNVSVRGLLAQTYLKREEPRAALEVLEPLLNSGNADPRIYAMAGDTLARMGEVKRAEAAYKKAVELNPKDSRSRILLAMRETSQSGSFDKGMDHLQDIASEFNSPVAEVAIVGALVRKGDLAGALKAVEKAESKLPAKGMADSMRASIYLMQGSPDKARASWEQALKLNPKLLPAALQLARLDQRDGKPRDGVARVAAVLKADPDNVDVKLNLLALRNDAGDKPEELIASARQIVKEHPKSATAQAALVRVLLYKQDVATALVAAQDGVGRIPDDASLIEQLGNLQLQQRDLKQAAATFKKLVALKPNSAAAAMRLVDVEVAMGDVKAALGNARRADTLQPGRLDTQRALVALQVELGDIPAARRQIKEIQKLPGREALAFVLEGDLEGTQRNWDAARAAYRRALERGGQLPGVAGKLHGAMVAGGKDADAQTFERQWLAEHASDMGFRTYLGHLALAQGRLDVARAHYEVVLKAQENSPVVRNNMAWMLMQSGDMAAAETHLNRALALRPGDPEVLDTQVQFLTKQNKLDQALVVQRKIVGIDANNPVRRVTLAKLLISAKQKDAARDELLAVQKLGKDFAGQAEVRQLLGSL